MAVLAALIVLGPFAYLYWWKENYRAAWRWLGWTALALFVAWVWLAIYSFTENPY